MTYRWGFLVAALALGGCVMDAPEPACVSQGGVPATPYPAAICGDEVRDTAPHIYEDGNAVIAVCGDAWSVRCDTRAIVRDDWVPTCWHGEIGKAPTCDRGGTPHCVVIPCDGETYYGPAHPGAGE